MSAAMVIGQAAAHHVGQNQMKFGGRESKLLSRIFEIKRRRPQMNQSALLEKVNQILGKDATHQTLHGTIEDLVKVVEQQQKELTEAHNRELSYIDDIQQLDAMIDQANVEIQELKALNTKHKYFDADDQH